MHTSLKIHTKISQPSKRQHLRRPIPAPLEITPIGKTLTEKEWEKFCSRYLFRKTQQHCERKMDGTISFLGEGALDALIEFQEKFKGRFHFRMICSTEKNAIKGAKLAIKNALNVDELRYKNDQHQTITLENEAIFIFSKRY